MKTSLHFIHIKNQERDNYAIPLLRALRSSLDAEVLTLHSFEGSGPNSKIGIPFVLYREWRLFLAERAMREDVFGKPVRSYFGTAIAFKNHVKNYLFNSVKLRNKKRQCSIEILNLDQHLRALGSFLDSGADYGLFFEDDVLFGPHSEAMLLYVKNNGFFNADYIDLAGGIEIDFSRVRGQYNARRLEETRLPPLQSFEFRKLFTNTSCGYAISRRLGVAIFDLLVTRPQSRGVFPVDWFYNVLFRDSMFESGFLALHFDPPLFRHGSKSAYTNPWRA